MRQQAELNPEDSTYEYILRIRSRMINGVLIAFACVAPFMLIISITRALQFGWDPIYILHATLSLITLLAALFRNRLPYSLRVSLFLGIAFILGAGGIPTFGLVGGGHLVLVIFSILAAIGFGTRIGLMACLINVLLMVAVGTAVCTGKITFSFNIAEFATSPSAWSAVIIDFVLIIPMAVLAIGSVFSQLQTLLNQLRQNHAAQQRLADNLTGSFLYRYSGQGIMEYVSSSAGEILGYSPEELTRLPEYLTAYEANREAFKVRSAKSGEEKRTPFEIQIYHKNGSRRWLHLSETTVHTYHGVKAEGVAHDITRRKIRETAIQNILKTFAAESGQDVYEEMIRQLVVTLQADAAFFGRLIDGERVKTEAFFVDGDIAENMEFPLKGTPCADIPKEELSFWTSGIRETYPNAKLLRKLQVEGYAGMRVTDKSGNHIGYLTAFWKEPAFESDLIAPVLQMYAEHLVIEYNRQQEQHRRASLEEQLRQSQKMEAVGQLAGGIAHDFNNMLMGIMGASDLLKMRIEGDAEALEYHRMIRTSSRRAADLTNQLLTFARKQSIGTIQTNVHECIENAVALLSSTLDRRITLHTEFLAEESTIIGDPSQIQNAIMNLSINASHSMHGGGCINIKTTITELDTAYCKASSYSIEPGKFISIQVEDEGHGIEEDEFEKIFEPFYTTKVPGTGTGLGLSTVLGTVQQHKGEIRLESTLDVGTVFIIQLPLCSVLEEDDQKTSNDRLSGTGSILFIDDEEIIRETSAETLRHMGYDVTTAENGRIGLECFQKNEGQFDLVILDMVMPEMNGMDCFFELKAIDDQVRVILCSGYADDHQITQMKAAGLCATVPKPTSSMQLSRIALNILNKLPNNPTRN